MHESSGPCDDEPSFRYPPVSVRRDTKTGPPCIGAPDPLDLSKFASICISDALRSPHLRKNGGMKTKAKAKREHSAEDGEHELWEIARSGKLRAAAEAARKALDDRKRAESPERHVELHLICASCAMRQGAHAEAIRELEAAAQAAALARDKAAALLRVDVWRAELAYFQGRYSDANATVARVLPQLETRRELAYAAFAMRIRIATLLARTDYDSIAALAGHAISLAEASGDDYVLVQVLNVLGAVAFDRAQ